MKTTNFSKPHENIKELALKEGVSVADFGAGSGFYTLALAEELNNTGKVYAIDVMEEQLAKLSNEASRRGLENIQSIWGDIERLGGTKLKDLSVDVVLITNVFFQLEDKEGTLKEAFRVISPGGKLLLVDWFESFGGMGPSPEHIVSEKEAVSLCENSGFNLIKKIDGGAHHYGLIFQKPV